MLNGTKYAAMQRPPVPYRGDNYQGSFTLTAGQELEMEATGQEKYKFEVDDGYEWDFIIRVNIYKRKVE